MDTYHLPLFELPRQHDLMPFGERTGPSKLTKKQVLYIRRLYDNGVRIVDIHKRFHFVDRSVISLAARRLTWKK